MRDFKQRMDEQKGERLFQQYSLIPSDLNKASFETYIPANDSQKDALKKAQWYGNNFKTIIESHEWNSLLFQGEYGLGKSHLSYSIANAVKEQGYKVVFIDTPSLLRLIRESFSNKSFSESDIHKVCAGVDLLVLDDIGAEYVKMKNGEESWAVDVLFQLIGSRVDKPKIFTTNYDSKGLSAKYGQHGGRIVSRMMKGTKPIKLVGEDYRTKGW